MNINQWISCISEAYEINGEAFSHRIKEMLLSKLSVDDLSQNEVIEKTGEVITHYFFRKSASGETFGPISRIKEKFGNSVEENYGLSSGPFINMAKTYWTFKIEVQDLFPKYHNLILAEVLLKVEGDIASVFFPTPGPAVIWVRQRRETQRQLLKHYTPEIYINDFLENNPILGTSESPISKRVINEKILVRCQNSDCLQILKIPNTVKTLQVTCTKCRTSFRFPAEDLLWLIQLRPDVHPESYKVDELEKLRQLYDIPHEIFSLIILSSPWVTRRIQESIYAQCREGMPRASEKELLKAVFASRALPRKPIGLEMTEEEIDETMKSIYSLEDLVNYFITRDEAEEPAPHDPLGIGARINEILSR